jgi:hypothetical protein
VSADTDDVEFLQEHVDALVADGWAEHDQDVIDRCHVIADRLAALEAVAEAAAEWEKADKWRPGDPHTGKTTWVARADLAEALKALRRASGPVQEDQP